MFYFILQSGVLTFATVVVHSFFASQVVMNGERIWTRYISRWPCLRIELMMTWVVSMLLLAHLFEVAVWAIFYWVAGLFSNFETSLYFSA